MAGTFPPAWQEVAIVTLQLKGGTSRNFAVITETVDISEPDYPVESVNNLAGGRTVKQSSQEDGEITLEMYPISIAVKSANKTISNIDGTASVITLDTSAAHGAKVGDRVTVTGTTNYNSTFTIATITDSDTVTINITGFNEAAETSGTAVFHFANQGLAQEFNDGDVDVVDPMTTDTTWADGVLYERSRFLFAIMWTTDTAVVTAIDATSGTDFTAKRFFAKECRLTSHKAAFTDGILKVTVVIKFPAKDLAGTTLSYAWESTGDTDTNPLPALTYT